MSVGLNVSIFIKHVSIFIKNVSISIKNQVYDYFRRNAWFQRYPKVWNCYDFYHFICYIIAVPVNLIRWIKEKIPKRYNLFNQDFLIP